LGYKEHVLEFKKAHFYGLEMVGHGWVFSGFMGNVLRVLRKNIILAP
jgi:hypothetical protein